MLLNKNPNSKSETTAPKFEASDDPGCEFEEGCTASFLQTTRPGVQGLGFRVQFFLFLGSGFRVSGSGFRA